MELAFEEYLMGNGHATKTLRAPGCWTFPATLPRRRPAISLLASLDDTFAFDLWMGMRRVLDWIDTPYDQRSAFVPAKHSAAEDSEHRARAIQIAPELAAAYDVLGILERSPRGATSSQLATACGDIAAWADRHNLAEVSVQFAEAAAVLEPESPLRSNLAGRACRKAMLWSRADQWLQRGLGLARHSNNGVEIFRAHLGAGAVALRQGRSGAARKHFLTGAWAAHRLGRRRLAARAQHDLMLLATERGRPSAALKHARRALEWYPIYHSRTPYLVHDFANALVFQGEYRAAAPLAEAVLPLVEAEHERVMVLGTITRAAAGAEQVQTYRASMAACLELASRCEQHAAAPFYSLAEGARLQAEWDLAHEFATKSLQLARTTGLAGIETLASTLLKELAARTPAASPPGRTAEERQHFNRLVHDFSARLARWRPGRDRSLDDFRSTP